MTHITMVIAKQLLRDKKKSLLASIKTQSKQVSSHAQSKSVDDVQLAVKAIDEELFILNNW